MRFVLILNKVLNFLFIITVISLASSKYDIGQLIIRATAVGGIFVAIIMPLFYSLIINNISQNAKSLISIIQLLIYFLISLLLILLFNLNSYSLGLVIFGFSLFVRGITDSLIVIEKKIILRGLSNALLVEPLRWALVFYTSFNSFFIIIFALTLPCYIDLIIRNRSFLFLIRKDYSFLKSFKSFREKLGSVNEISKNYSTILYAQSEQIFIFIIAGLMTAAESKFYILSMQGLGFMIIAYQPYWFELINSIKNSSKKLHSKMLSSRLKYIFKLNIIFIFIILILLIILNIGLFELLTNHSSVKKLFGFLGIYSLENIIQIVMLFFFATLFRSVFIDINLIASIDTGRKNIFIGFFPFIFILLLFSIFNNLMTSINFVILAYALGYLLITIKVIYQTYKYK
jgi:hypothetical protein